MFISFLLATGLDVHWYDNFLWLCFNRLEQITSSASQCRGVRPHRGDAAYARHISHRVCLQLLPVTAARCSELSVQSGRLVVHCCSAQISSRFPRLLSSHCGLLFGAVSSKYSFGCTPCASNFARPQFLLSASSWRWVCSQF